MTNKNLKRHGPKCPQCEAWLVKRNNRSGRYYECRRHGFVRDIVPVYPVFISKESTA